MLTVIGLIGTTVVPYNLFLHASSVQEKWPATMPKPQALHEARVDTSVAVALGGLITLAVVASAAFHGQGELTSAAILIAQVANGLLLPLIALFLLFAVNRRDLMGSYKNRWRGNLAGGLVVLVAAGLGIHSLLTKVLGG